MDTGWAADGEGDRVVVAKSSGASSDDDCGNQQAGRINDKVAAFWSDRLYQRLAAAADDRISPFSDDG